MTRGPSALILSALAFGTALTTGLWPVVAARPALAQPAPPPPPAVGSFLSAAELNQVLAPIALYPDETLGQILTAATYPLEIVEANRWSKAAEAQGLSADARADALERASWDPSVKAVAAFPELLDLLDRDLTWTQKLGDAFLVQQAEVMDAIQRLRAQARAAGNLDSGAETVVRVVDRYIYIEPAQPDVIYLPYYDPYIVYGAWTWGAYPPVVIVARSAVQSRGRGLFFSRPLPILRPYWGWHHWDWQRRELRVDRDRFAYGRNHVNFERRDFGPPDNDRARIERMNTWRHDPGHRRNVPYGGRGRGEDNRARDNNRTDLTTPDLTRPDDTRRDKGPGDGTAREDRRRDNLGRDNLGRDNVGRDNLGRENTGRENTGRENNGRENNGRENNGRGPSGVDTTDRDNINREDWGGRFRQNNGNERAGFPHGNDTRIVPPPGGTTTTPPDGERRNEFQNRRTDPIQDFRPPPPPPEQLERPIRITPPPTPDFRPPDGTMHESRMPNTRVPDMRVPDMRGPDPRAMAPPQVPPHVEPPRPEAPRFQPRQPGAEEQPR